MYGITLLLLILVAKKTTTILATTVSTYLITPTWKQKTRKETQKNVWESETDAEVSSDSDEEFNVDQLLNEL